MRFLAIITALLAAAPAAVLSQADGPLHCRYGNRDDYPKSLQPDGREARKLRRCFKNLSYQWDTGARCRKWWVVSRGHRWHNPHHCWKACHGCIDRAISDHQPEVYCDKFKVAARCIMSYKPLAPKRDPDDDDDDDDDEELLGLDGGGHHHDNNNNNGTSSAAAVDEEDEFLPDMYNPEWENEEEDGDNVDWDDEETDS